MLLAKSEKAKSLLSLRDASLGAKERQILIMCNGARTDQELVVLFGSAVKPVLDRFIGNGLLIDASNVLANESGVLSKTGTYYASDFLIHATAKVDRHNEAHASAKPAQVVAQTQAASNTSELKKTSDRPASLSGKSKRSVAASKMYMVNLLQMHRDLDSSTLAVNIHTSEDEQQLIANILAALRYISRKGGLEYGRRIADQLGHILPEVYMPDLEAFIEECFSALRPSLVNAV